MSAPELSLPLERACSTPDELHRWVVEHLGMSVPRRAICAGHDAPFDYLRWAYFEPAQDCVVWAPRGGGKTRLGAAATLLDLLHKPGVSVRILGGSLEQSRRMWEHLTPDLERLLADGESAAGGLRQRVGEIRLKQSGSMAAVLTQSQKAVRGLRVQKMRCDEVELFTPAVWEAAQLVTKSKVDGHGRPINATIEAISTWHVPGGLMSKVIDNARATGRRVFSWCILDVLERCPPERPCETCPLQPECQGRAKAAEGFVSIDDAIAMKQRVSDEVWRAEMLCHTPSLTGRVFGAFDPKTHVMEWADVGDVALGVDFGYANPFVCLWIARLETGKGLARYHVVDEYVQSQRMMDEHIRHIESRSWPRPVFVGHDPAGNATNEQTAKSSADLLRAAGFSTRSCKKSIVAGVEELRVLLRISGHLPLLTVHPRCRKLITALMAYRYPDKPDGENPLKDGEHDHLIDALRYWAMNRKRTPEEVRTY